MPAPPSANNSIPTLDVRPSADFELAHAPGAVNIPLEQLRDRIHELPPTRSRLLIYDHDDRRARWARSRLRLRGRWQLDLASGPEWLNSRPHETGANSNHLWRPHPLLAEALAAARAFWPDFTHRRALDIACGAGRDAVFLAMHGFSVDALDLLPDAIARCNSLAQRHAVPLRAFVHDIQADPSIEPDRYDLVCTFNFLHRPLMPVLAAALRPGGLLIYETFNEQNRAAFNKPRRDSHILKMGELREFFPSWPIITWREGPAAPRRFVSSLIARKPLPIA